MISSCLSISIRVCSAQVGAWPSLPHFPSLPAANASAPRGRWLVACPCERSQGYEANHLPTASARRGSLPAYLPPASTRRGSWPATYPPGTILFCYCPLPAQPFAPANYSPAAGLEAPMGGAAWMPVSLTSASSSTRLCPLLVEVW